MLMLTRQQRLGHAPQALNLIQKPLSGGFQLCSQGLHEVTAPPGVSHESDAGLLLEAHKVAARTSHGKHHWQQQ